APQRRPGRHRSRRALVRSISPDAHRALGFLAAAARADDACAAGHASRRFGCRGAAMSDQNVVQHLLETREAFDSDAVDYDGPRGNNDLIQDMRREMWQWLDEMFPAPSRLIDLGCGTGLDAVRMADRGHDVLATD